MTIEKKGYHHGALREELIEKGLQLIHEEGIDHFSLRKVAAACNVSHTAPYKHFKNKEELVDAIIEYIMQEFTEEIQKVAKEHLGERCLLEVGKRYVTYMLEHKDYFHLLFMGEKKVAVRIKEGHFMYEEGHPFGAFIDVATAYLKDTITDENVRNNIILHCWSTVHGLTYLLINGIVQDEGDYAQLAEKTLLVMDLGMTNICGQKEKSCLQKM